MSRPNRTFEPLIELLQQLGPMTAAEIAAEFGVSVSAARRRIRRLRLDQPGVIRISGHRRLVGQPGRDAPIFALGSGPDAKRNLPPLEERKREYQHRHRQKYRAEQYLKGRAQKGREINPFTSLIYQVTRA